MASKLVIGVIAVVIIVVAAFAVLRLMASSSDDSLLFVSQKARQFCGQENVSEVNVLGNSQSGYYVETISSLLGGGSSLYKFENGSLASTPIRCPVVGPDSITQECKALLYGNLPKTKVC